MTKIKDLSNKEQIADIIEDLKQKTIEIPSWSELKKEYDPKLHPVMTDPNYKDIVTKDGIEKVVRYILAYQKLAANRISQLMFGIPAKRTYKPKKEDEKEERAAKILERIYEKNRIDSMNMQRAVMFFAGCEMATLWFAVEGKNDYYGESSLIKIRCKTYSPMDSKDISVLNTANLYPLFDEYDDMVGMAFEYIRKKGKDTVKYFDAYTDEEHIRYINEGGNDWKEDTQPEEITIEKIPIAYGFRPSPIWEDSSSNVYEIEWSVSRSGNYLRKNSKPNFGVFSDKKIDFGKEGSENSEFRTVNQYPKDARFEYATWEQAIESLKFFVQELKQSYFTQLQLPDLSAENLKLSNISADALEIMLLDAQLKVTQESGRLLEFFDREMNIVKALAKKAFPELATAFDALSVEHTITPYKLNDETKRINNIMTATGGKAILSQEEGVRELGYAEDVTAEMEKLRNEAASNTFEPYV